jgi:cytoskeleton protein RodZ
LQPAVQAGNESLASVGARLAQLRGAKGWSIEDVSARLKVPVAKLRALEAGDLSQLPDTTFALGVVRSYAKMLGADPTPYTDALRRERRVPAPDLKMPASAGTDLPRGRVSLSLGNSAPRRRSWLWGVAAVIVALIALAMWHTNGGDSSAWLARLKATTSGASVSNSAAGGVSGASASVAQGQTSAQPDSAQGAASGSGESQPAPAADAGSQQQAQMPVPLPMTGASASAAAPGAATANATNAAHPAAAAAASAPATNTTAAGAAAASTPAAPAGSSTVALKVAQDSWLSVRQKDGKEVFSGLVHAGDSKEISGDAPFKVTIGNRAGLESITFDGQPVDPSKYAAAKGNVARFALP